MHDESFAADAAEAAPPEPTAPAATAEAPSPPVTHRFEFRGNAREYFRIWIVNVALGIVTLGIYSAWASVRTRRYFYANTWLAGSPFEYHAQPLPILRGRIIAALLFTCYILAGHATPAVHMIAVALIALLLPWLIVRGMSFRARYSSWRGLRFHFNADYTGAYLWYLVAYLLMIPTLGMIYPWIKQRQQRFTVNQHRFGSAGFAFDSGVGSYYGVFFACIGIGLVALFAMGIVVAIVVGSIAAVAPQHNLDAAMKQHPFVVLALVYVLYLPAYLAIHAYNRSRILNLLYNGTQLAGGHRLHSTLGFGELFWIYLSNIVVIVGTLGLATPWAKVRMVRYRAEHLALDARGNLDAFVADTQAQTDVSAFGAEMDGFFDIDIGL